MALNKTLSFDLELKPGGIPPIVHASQGDIGRMFKANIYWDGAAATSYISGATVNLRGKKPDKTVFDYTATLAGSMVTFETTEQMTIISGPVECELVFSNDGDIIASANFVLIVEDSPYDPDALSESDVEGLTDVLEGFQRLNRDSNGVVKIGDGVTASGTAEPIKGFYVHDEVTDTDGVAKYDAGALANLDNTVNLRGYAPDAKAVGDRLSAVEETAAHADELAIILNEGGLELKDSVLTEQVDTWLDNHPEATTTVQDGSITKGKISPNFLPYITATTYVTNLQELNKALVDGKSFIVLANGSEFIVDSQIDLKNDKVLYGYGAKIIRADGYDGLLLRVGENTKVCGLEIDGNRVGTVSPTWDTTTEIRVAEPNAIIEDVTITNGNEAIVIYGSNTVVSNCKISNCGGNGIHFSGASNVRVENTVVIGANKKSGMGHEDGCIIWSDSCNYVTCIGNWVEDGISGFGSLDWENNDHAKIIGNTIKNCRASAFDITSSVKFPKNIIISNNTIIDSIKVIIANYQSDQVMIRKIIFSNNQLINTSINARWVDGIVVDGNTLENGQIEVSNCDNAIVNNNIISFPSGTCIYAYNSDFLHACNNIIKCKVFGISDRYGASPTIIGNTIFQSYHTDNASEPAIKIDGSAGECNGAKIIGNTLFIYYGFGLYPYHNCMVLDNIIYTALDTIVAINYSSANAHGMIIKNNMSNGVLYQTQGANNRVSDNIACNVSKKFLEVVQTLTNITSNRQGRCIFGDDYTLTLTADSGFSLPSTITVTMGGNTLVNGTDYTYDNTSGDITIFNVFNSVELTATA